MATYLLGLLGKKRSGKDTVANYLVSQHGFTRFAFADALKDYLLDIDPPIDGRPLSQIIDRWGWEKAKEIPQVRSLLQDTGSALRSLDPNFWIDIIREQVDAADTPVVISDVRLPNEATWIKDSGGALWRIHRPETESPDDHHTETALDGYPVGVHLINHLTLNDLYTFVDFVLGVRTAAGRMI